MEITKTVTISELISDLFRYVVLVIWVKIKKLKKNLNSKLKSGLPSLPNFSSFTKTSTRNLSNFPDKFDFRAIPPNRILNQLFPNRCHKLIILKSLYNQYRNNKPICFIVYLMYISLKIFFNIHAISLTSPLQRRRSSTHSPSLLHLICQ